MNFLLIDLWPFAFAILITQVLYAFYRLLSPKSPPHHKRFIIFAVLMTVSGNTFIVFKTFFSFFCLVVPIALGVGYSTYKLIMNRDEAKRARLSLLIFILLTAWLSNSIYKTYDALYVPRACKIVTNADYKARAEKLFDKKKANCIERSGQMKF